MASAASIGGDRGGGAAVRRKGSLMNVNPSGCGDAGLRSKTGGEEWAGGGLVSVHWKSGRWANVNPGGEECAGGGGVCVLGTSGCRGYGVSGRLGALGNSSLSSSVSASVMMIDDASESYSLADGGCGCGLETLEQRDVQSGVGEAEAGRASSPGAEAVGDRLIVRSRGSTGEPRSTELSRSVSKSSGSLETAS
jgi:hypothetical protein